MDVKSTATYPYPIWGIYDGFNGEKPLGKRGNVTRIPEEDVLEVEYEILNHNSGIDKLIEEGKAEYVFIISCSKTYYLQVEKPQDLHFRVKVPCSKIYNRFSCKVQIVATQQIDACDYLDVNAVYEGIVYYPKGALIALIDSYNIGVQASGDLMDLSKIITRMFADVPTVENVLGERIVIKIPLPYREVYESVEGYIPSVVEATLVRSALVEALCEFSEHYEEDNKDWVFSLKQYIDGMAEDGEITIPDEYRFSIKDVYTIVDSILPDVMLETLKDVNALAELNLSTE